MKKKLLWILIIVFVFPVFVFAEGKNSTIIYDVKAEITFNNENIVINEKVSAGEKLIEPSHIDFDGYTFLGWFVGDHRWDFANDVVTNHTTLEAKYKKNETIIDTTTNNNNNDNNYMNSSVVVESDDIDLSDSDKEHLGNGRDIIVWVEVTDINETIEEEEVKLINTFSKKKDLKVDSYFDVELFKAISGVNNSTEKIDETNNNVQVTITIPEDLRVIGRKYYLLRLHDDVVETVFSGYPSVDWKIVFETDSFSTYAFAHEDADTATIVPNTSDKVVVLFAILFVSIVGLSLSYKSIKKLK